MMVQFQSRLIYLFLTYQARDRVDQRTCLPCLSTEWTEWSQTKCPQTRHRNFSRPTADFEGYSCQRNETDSRECCPDDWKQTDHGCYKVVQEKPLNWADASRVCAKLGGYLAELTTPGEGAAIETWLASRDYCISVGPQANSALTRWCNNNCYHAPLHCPENFCSCGRVSLWIGLTDQQEEGRFVWSHSNSSLGSYVKWRNGEPNNGVNFNVGVENCVHLSKTGMWNDLNCAHSAQQADDLLYALCEFNIELPGPEQLHQDQYFAYYKVRHDLKNHILNLLVENSYKEGSHNH